MFYDITLLCVGVFLGHVGSQWFSYKNTTFFMCNQYAIQKMDMQYQMLKRVLYTTLGFQYVEPREKHTFQMQLKNMLTKFDPVMLQDLAAIFQNMNKKFSQQLRHRQYSPNVVHHRVHHPNDQISSDSRDHSFYPTLKQNQIQYDGDTRWLTAEELAATRNENESFTSQAHVSSPPQHATDPDIQDISQDSQMHSSNSTAPKPYKRKPLRKPSLHSMSRDS